MVSVLVGIALWLAAYAPITVVWVVGAVVALRRFGMPPWVATFGGGTLLWNGEIAGQRVELRAVPSAASLTFGPPGSDEAEDGVHRLPFVPYALLQLWTLTPPAAMAATLAILSGDPVDAVRRVGRFVGAVLGLSPSHGGLFHGLAAISPDRHGLGVLASALGVVLAWSLIPLGTTPLGNIALRVVKEWDEFVAWRVQIAQMVTLTLATVAVFLRLIWMDVA